MTPLIPELSHREEEVVMLIADGLSYDEIGTRLRITSATVQDHRDNARRKLGAASTPHLVAIVIRARSQVPA